MDLVAVGAIGPCQNYGSLLARNGGVVVHVSVFTALEQAKLFGHRFPARLVLDLALDLFVIDVGVVVPAKGQRHQPGSIRAKQASGDRFPIVRVGIRLV